MKERPRNYNKINYSLRDGRSGSYRPVGAYLLKDLAQEIAGKRGVTVADFSSFIEEADHVHHIAAGAPIQHIWRLQDVQLSDDAIYLLSEGFADNGGVLDLQRGKREAKPWGASALNENGRRALQELYDAGFAKPDPKNPRYVEMTAAGEAYPKTAGFQSYKQFGKLLSLDPHASVANLADMPLPYPTEGKEARDIKSAQRYLGLIPSEITCQGTADRYMQGECHILALAAAEVVEGVQYRLIGFEDPYESVYENPDDPDDVVSAMVHVYAVVEVDGRDMALDIYGMRPVEMAQKECETRFGGRYLSEVDLTKNLLMDLTQRPDGTERSDCMPLCAVTEDAMESAKATLREAFPHLVKDTECTPVM